MLIQLLSLSTEVDSFSSTLSIKELSLPARQRRTRLLPQSDQTAERRPALGKPEMEIPTEQRRQVGLDTSSLRRIPAGLRSDSALWWVRHNLALPATFFCLSKVS